MSDSQAPQHGKKRSHDLSDIMSMLGEDKPGMSPKAPVQETPTTTPVTQEKQTEPAIVEPQKTSIEESSMPPAEEPKQAVQQDNAIVDRLLADFAQKNEEILRLNNELTQIKFEVREKEQKISALISIEAVLDEKENALKSKDAVIRDKEESIKDKESTIKEREAALKEKDALLKEKETLLKEIELALAAKDAEIKIYEARVRDLETKIDEMSEQLGTIRKFTARESSHEPLDEPVTAQAEKQEINIQEQMSAEEDDVGSIFRRLAEARAEEPQGEECQEKPRRPRSAKLYDL
jgi:chromosome segregation ATPase